MDSEIKKTNLPILDLESWNWLKNKKNEFNLESIAEYLFKVINYSRKDDKFEKEIILKNLEKYYEYHFYNMDYLVQNVDLKQQYVIKLINNIVGKEIPLFGLGTKDQIESARKKIHELMVYNDIIPRELAIAFKFRNYIHHKYPLDIPNTIEIPDDILFNMFYPDEEEKRMELYSYTSNLLLQYLEREKKPNFNRVKCSECDKSDICMFKRPDLIYLQIGIKADLDEIQDDFIANTIKEYTSYYLQIYGMFLQLSIEKLLKYNLTLVQRFDKNDIVHFSEHILKTIKGLDLQIDRKIEKTQQTLNEYGVILAQSN